MAQTKNHDAAEIRIREIRGAINELEGAVKQLETRAHDLASQLEGVLSTSTTEKSPSVREPCRCPIVIHYMNTLTRSEILPVIYATLKTD